MPCTLGFPEVIVPVLSNTIVSIECSCSNMAADLIKIPFSAALPVPTMIATGVAKPKAQGQEITNTLIALESANWIVWPLINHTTNVINAIKITTGTNTPLTWSAKRAIGAFEFPASSTSWMIWANVVSCPTFSASNWKVPFSFIVAEITESPTFFSIGRLSPVIADWST